MRVALDQPERRRIDWVNVRRFGGRFHRFGSVLHGKPCGLKSLTVKIADCSRRKSFRSFAFSASFQ